MRLRTFARGLAVMFVPLALAASDSSRADDETSLEGRIKPLIDAHKGEVGVVVKNLDTGETFAHRPDEPMPTASLIKFPVMIEAYRQDAAGTIRLADKVRLEDADKVPGSGILTQLSTGLELPLRDAVRLMIALSDNTATNLVLDRIGIDATAAEMDRLGCPETKIHSKVYRRETSVFPDRSPKYGLGSTTAAEMVRLFEALHRKELVSPEASEAMLDHLRHCDDEKTLPRFLPSGTRVAFKTGAVDASRTAAGILYSPAGPIAVCVLTTDNEDRSWVPDNAGVLLTAEVARAAWDYFNAKDQPEAEAKVEPAAAVR